ncbi:tRNA pseudouridine(55) synthase TruB [Candidatus Kaiserbacteria bacterium CG_4_9_14_0_2_um_filter_41_32]|uniref:tRNA pseudouridine(55) synthase n=1 Tax=Candidatus Kaiserbacteria bacterium CG_4_9_14_0_2_um_filter_41_32 TaxID=1974601 RepID=A0A2M8FE19_9BACT|nr:MAG: tRNA pseudouridine(55) synthase TruB [Candidatus Kaiserbacteria bacterium CG_4_9_14_0_2_um_filter_41_32]
MTFNMDEIILIDKPIGVTSFDVIRQLRRRIGIKKIGHAGTLDPLASGLMILGVGPGTKRLTEFIKLDKEYIAEVLIGESRTTGDMEGEVVQAVTEVYLTPQTILEVVASMVGTLTLPVSAYSAIKRAGVPMYKRAREAARNGEVVTFVPVREMAVYKAELLDIKNTIINDSERVVVRIRFFVGSGTYIRSLGEELGRRLGYPATLQNLRRTKVGEFDIKNAKKIEDF